MTSDAPHSNPNAPAPAPLDRRALIAGGVMLALMGAVLVGLAAFGLGGSLGLGQTPAPTVAAGAFAYAAIQPAPPLELIDQDGKPFKLTDLKGAPTLVFFGYTHCPDVCPATIGNVNQALSVLGDGPRAVFVSIDPDRDDPAAMAQYVKYLPKAYIGLSGTPENVRRMADGWGIRYTKIETDSANGYAMAHTADLFLVDAQGMLRARFPFGTEGPAIAAEIKAMMAAPAATTTAATSAPLPTPAAGTPAAVADDVLPLVVSTSIFAGPKTPVIFTARDTAGAEVDGTVPVTARLVTTDRTTAYAEVPVTALRPEGSDAVSLVALLDIPSAGAWRLDVLLADGRSGSTMIQVLDPGATPPLGQLAPAVDTPTLDDVGGVVRAVTTQPNPDLRFSKTSTADSLAAGKPYVLIVDSSRFRVSPACGRALTMARFLLDRWPSVTFVHLEPFEYQIITEEPVLSGSLTDPPLNRYARAFGLGPDPWPGTQMPWIFIVDGHGILRAKYTGIVGSADVDIILTLIAAEG